MTHLSMRRRWLGATVLALGAFALGALPAAAALSRAAADAQPDLIVMGKHLPSLLGKVVLDDRRSSTAVSGVHCVGDAA